MGVFFIGTIIEEELLAVSRQALGTSQCLAEKEKLYRAICKEQIVLSTTQFPYILREITVYALVHYKEICFL